MPWKENELYCPVKHNESNFKEVQGSVDIALIPYYAWVNRGLAFLDLWIPLAR